MTQRTIHIDRETLLWGARLSPEDRLRQANAAFRLYHVLHHPYDRAFSAGFDSFDELLEFERRNNLPR